MNKLYILVGFALNFSMLFSQDCNANLYTEDDAIKLSAYGKNLEKSILDKNPGDTALIAKLQGDYSTDLCGYNDESVIKISNYLKELEKLDSINKIVKEEIVKEEVVKVIPVETKVKEVAEVKTTELKTKTTGLKTSEVTFASNSSQLRRAKFDGILAELKADPKAKVEIEGYTDADGADEFNLALSKRRAKTVKDYLISRGIKADRITTNAYGEQKPVADNSTEEGKSKNRRVVISVK